VVLGTAADPCRPIASLSGGNQQKVVVWRGGWEADVHLLILEEPIIRRRYRIESGSVAICGSQMKKVVRSF
jgi:hypothetical protein